MILNVGTTYEGRALTFPHGFGIDVYENACSVARRRYLFFMQTSRLIDPAVSILTLSEYRPCIDELCNETWQATLCAR